MIKAVIFDWGGVLSPCNNRAAAKHFAEKYGVIEEDIYKDMDNLEDEFNVSNEDNSAYYREIGSKYDIKPEEVKSVLNNVPVWDVFSYVKTLKGKVRLFVLSNQMKPRTDAIKNDNDLSFFDNTFFSNEVGIMKPDKRIFQIVLERIGLKADECMFIDDCERNLIPARELGFNTILFKNLEQLKQSLSKLKIIF